MSDLPAHTTVLTERLCLEPFAVDHAPALNAMNREERVMEFLLPGPPPTMDETRDSITRVRAAWQTLGYSWWTITLRATGQIAGAACLQNVARIPGAELEIGWRLAAAHTGQGYATEAGLAAARYAFDVVGADHVIAVADQRNINSHRVMERIGMTYRGIERHYDADCTTYVLHKSDLT